MTIDHQENVGRKREKRKYGATQEKAAGTELKRILLVMKITFGAKRTGEERIPRGTTLFAGAGLTKLFLKLDQMLSEFHR